jgi:alkylated DNA nucleotide flippase Atl1
VAKKTWNQKLTDAKNLPRLEKLEGKAAAKFGEGTLLIPAPLEVDAQMRRVPKGRLVTTNEIRTALAQAHGARIACPLCTGIFARIAAEATEEAGGKPGNPYWRTLKAGGEINPKYPGGPEAAAKRLKAEGHEVVKKGQRYFVTGFAKALMSLV